MPIVEGPGIGRPGPEPTQQRPSAAVRRRELLKRRVLPAVLAACILIFVLVPLVLGFVSAGKEAMRLLDHAGAYRTAFERSRDAQTGDGGR